MDNYYLIIKSLHIISIIAWFSGLLYLPRLFVYHVKVKIGGELDSTLKIMEKKLLFFIIHPAMLAAIIFGVLLIIIIGKTSIGLWFHAKMSLVIGLLIFQTIISKHRKAFSKGENEKSEKYFKIINEIPTVIMIIAVFLAVLKPM